MASSDRQLDRRTFLTAVGSATAATALAGCTGDTGEQQTTEPPTDAPEDESGTDTPAESDDEETDEEATVLTYARGNDSGSLDFQNTTSGEDAKVTNQIYDPLIAFEPGETSLREGLATDYSVDGTTVSLTLREGVTFHNGEEFTADDWIATYRRFTDSDYDLYPGEDYISSYGPYALGNWIDSVSADGDYEATVELNDPYAPILPNLAMFCSRVHSEVALEEIGTDLSENPVGTGPFQFENWDTGNGRIRLSANEDYWGETPNVDEVVFTAIGQNSTRAQTLDTGDADIIDGLGAQSSQVVENSDNAELVSMPGINVGYLAFNMAQREEFRDKRVRQAISHAINTEAIVNTIFNGIASQASQPIPDSVMGYNEDLDPYAYDTEQAQSLLEEAGYGDGFAFELATFQNPRTYNPSPIQAAETVRSNLSDVGIEITINQQPFNPFLEYTDQGKHDACFLGWMTDNADPDNFYYALLHPGVSVDDVPEDQDWVSYDTEGFSTLDAAAWANTEFMELVEEAQTSYDNDERAELYKQAAEIAHEEAPWVFMDHAMELRGVHNGVSGFTLAPISGPYLNLVSKN